jgi:uncharacterized protein YndB with AHSA1/START domain
VQSLGCMSDTVEREVDLPCTPNEAWEYIIDPAWLGDDGDLEAVPGADGKVIDDGEERFLFVEAVEPAKRLVFRWASFGDPPTRVEIELAPIDAGTRIKITEMPINARAQALVSV